MKVLSCLFCLPLVLCACAAGLPQGDPPSVPFDAPADAPIDAVRLTWMGTAGCFISDGESAFYIDPFVSRPGLLKVGLGFGLSPQVEQIAHWCRRTGKRADAVIVSHSHYDHAMDAPFFAQKTGALLVGSESTAMVGRGAGLEEKAIRVVQAGDRIRIGRFNIRFLESRHGPALFGKIPWPGRIEEPLEPPASASSYRLGETFALVIEHPRGTLVHNGSAGYLPGMFDGIRADVVLLGIAGREDTQGLLENVVLPLGARTVIPIHHDHFFSSLDKPVKPLWGINLEEFEQTAGAYGDRFGIKWVQTGEPVVLFLF